MESSNEIIQAFWSQYNRFTPREPSFNRYITFIMYVLRHQYGSLYEKGL